MKRRILILVTLVCFCNLLAYSQKKAPLKAFAAAGSHSVALTCTASTSSGVTGYNFYRGAAAGGESATALNASPVTACAYTDSTVAPLTSYFYTAKAFCPTCTPNLSAASNEATAAVPGDPQPLPPSGLTVGTITQNKVPLLWQAPPTQGGYDVIATEVFRQPAGLAALKIATLPNWLAAYTDTVQPGAYSYWVKAYDIRNNNFTLSAKGNTVEVTVQ